MTTFRRLAVLSLSFAILASSDSRHTSAIAATLVVEAAPGASASAATRATIPLNFQENRGQAPVACRFLSSAGGYELCLEASAIELTGLQRISDGKGPSGRGADTVRLTFHGAAAGSLAGVERLTGTANFLTGADPAAWITGVPTFRRVRRQNLYSGIDMIVYGNERDVEYDLVVAPQADPSVVRIRVEGAKPRIGDQGHVLLATRGGIFELRPPRVYQEVGRSRRPVAAAYELTASGDIGFRLASFDRSRPLIIDPVIAFATYLGGPDNDIPSGLAVDPNGNTYIAATVQRGNGDVLVTKLDPTGVHVVYSTYIGGTFLDAAGGVAVDAEGHAFVTGHTQSANFPTVDALQPALSGAQSAFVSKLSPDGASLEFSTYFGSGFASLTRAIAVDAQQNVWIGGNGEVPTKSSIFDTGPFVAKISGSGEILHFSTKLGGSGISVVRGLAVDADGDAYVVGSTNATDFPVLNAYQPTSAGGSEGFVMKLSSATTLDPLLLDTFDTENMGEPGTAVPELSAWHVLEGEIDLIAAGSGLAATTPSPGAGASIQRRSTVTLSPGESIFASANVAAYRLELDVIGPPGPAPGELTVSIGSALAETFTVAGHSATAHFTRDFIVAEETTAAAIVEWSSGNHQPALDRIQLARIRETPVLSYSTYLGGAGTDLAYGVTAEPSGAVHVAGVTSSANFPLINAFQDARQGATDAFVVRLGPTGNPSYSTLLGGTGDEDIPTVAVDSEGNTLVAGQTTSVDFPTLNALQPSYAGGWDGFLTKILADGSLGYSTYIGASQIDWPTAVAVDRDGSAYVVMQTTSDDHVTVNAAQPLHGGSNDSYVIKIADTAQLRAFGLSQSRGGNAGQVTTRIFGANFSPGPVTVKLVGVGPDIVAHSAVATDAGTITATFDLFGAPAGVRDVVVTFADGRTVTLNSAFTVESGGEPHVWVDVIGRSQARRNVTTTYYVVVGNQGTVDAPGVGVKVTVPSGVTIQPDFPLATSPGSVGAPAVIARGDGQIVPLLLPVIPAGGTITLPFTVAASAPSFDIGVEVEQWLLNSPSRRIVLAAPDVFQCVLGGFTVGLSVVSLPASGARALGLALLGRYFSAVNAAADGNNDPLSLVDEYASVIADGTPLGRDAGFALTSAVFEAMPVIPACANVLDRLREPFSVVTFGAIDPNEKTGPSGAGPQGYVTSQQPLRYAVHFENLAAATAPAATVVVEDQLDLALFDPASVDFGAIAIGSRVLTQPFGSSLATDVDLRPEQNLIARVRAGVNAVTGVVRLEITSIDPLTGLPPLDPLAGFLPPNVDGREGTGSLLFTVRLRPSLPEGAQIANKATITFDANAPIETNLWVNTLDETSPTSEVLPLAAEQGSASVTVGWTGSDSGSQIRDFSIWVSEDDGPYSLWILATPATSAVFQGQFGHRYSFYSLARDMAGNVEGAPASADASTLVIDRAAPATSCGATDPAWHAANVAIPCEASDTGSGLAHPEDQHFQLTTSVPAGTETALALTGSHEVCDVSGNCVTAGPLGPIKIDRASPTISIAPIASPLVLNQVVAVTYSCLDGGSGVASCLGSRPSGSSIATSSVGTAQFAVDAIDNVGNTASSSASYVVAYAVCVDYDQEKAHRSGSTIPLKIRLCDAAGQNVSSASIPVTATSVTRIGDQVSNDIADAGSANPDANFRYAGGAYIFNLKLTGYATGVYELAFQAGGDGSAHVVRFQVR